MSEGPGRVVLLGHPLGHSLSPVFQNAAFRAAGIAVTYEALDTPRSALTETVAALRRQRGAGNVTVPHKEAMLALCDRLTFTARAVGAVNTFWTGPDGALVGDNTDAPAFDATVRQLVALPAGATVAVLGAGGAAAAVLHALKGWVDPAIRLYARTPTRAERLVQRMQVRASIHASAADAVQGALLVVNATPVGLRAEAAPVAADALPPDCAVYDLTYRQGDTALVQAARDRGLRATDGLGMLIEQGALAFERWFGIPADREVMWDALRMPR